MRKGYIVFSVLAAISILFFACEDLLDLLAVGWYYIPDRAIKTASILWQYFIKKGWCLDMIKAILYSDVYRPMAYSLFSVFMVYSLRKEKIKNQIFFYSVYMLYAIGLFSAFSVLVILANEDIVAKDFLWGIERIGFYFVIVIAQHFVYKIGGIGKNINLLIINVVIVLISSYIGMKYFFLYK